MSLPSGEIWYAGTHRTDALPKRAYNDLLEVRAKHETTQMPCMRRHRTGSPLKLQGSIRCKEDYESEMRALQRDRTAACQIEVIEPALVSRTHSRGGVRSPPLTRKGIGDAILAGLCQRI